VEEMKKKITPFVVESSSKLLPQPVTGSKLHKEKNIDVPVMNVDSSIPSFKFGKAHPQMLSNLNVAPGTASRLNEVNFENLSVKAVRKSSIHSDKTMDIEESSPVNIKVPIEVNNNGMALENIATLEK
jgi:hypothetical protein